MINKKLKVGNVPNLRFPQFTEEWETKKLGEIAKKIGDGLHGTPIYVDESDFYFINGNNLVNGKIELNENTKKIDAETSLKNDKQLRENTLLISINGTIGNIAKYNNENVMLGKSVGYFNFDENSDFLYFVLQTKLIQNFFNSEQTGSTIKNLSLKTLRETLISRPNQHEQQKIATFLSLVDERIQTQNKIIEELKLLKITLRYQLYEQILNHENEYVQVKDTLNYEQPTKYLVTNTDYSSDISLIPVLTANKAFVLGYTDEEFGIYDKSQCIIFDDFTMDIKFVNFPFKVKSSAIKILTAKPNVNLKFIFEYLSFLNLSSNEHKRHYISEIETMEMQLPNYIQQTYVADFLASIDDKIKTEFEIHTLLLKQKQYLLANLFI